MEKISLYDLLSVLLPGALLSLFIEVILKYNNINLVDMEINEYFKLTVFLSSAIFLGSAINIITQKLIKFYKIISLHKPISKIYKHSKELKKIDDFFDKKAEHLCKEKKKKDFDKKIERLWSEIYYELEAKDQIKTPKSFQSFYFFFRNFFTLSLVLSIVFLIILFFHFDKNMLIIIGFNILILVISYFGAIWNRKKMVIRMFWTYYSLYKN